MDYARHKYQAIRLFGLLNCIPRRRRVLNDLTQGWHQKLRSTLKASSSSNKSRILMSQVSGSPGDGMKKPLILAGTV
ncbi:hypothetical protein ARMGADRAFT_1020748 [Armillaria gallica]|uniref:Uncharacterized protein n=1 Tax=Armillaria gallica TaxID=47427 RepID=A0A2H3CND4_ARMGA|nr:hypothetical protein ARMGADRAFT_1020748 [Armillaria gallica]